MSLPVIFKPAARLEFDEAVAWYENELPGLGREFKLEVKLALERALAHPQHFQRVRGRARKIRLRRFKKYAVYFAIKDDSFAMLSIFHASRHPALLHERLKWRTHKQFGCEPVHADLDLPDCVGIRAGNHGKEEL